MTDRIHTGLRWLSGEYSATDREFHYGNLPDGFQLLQGLVSHGYAHRDRKTDRYAVTDAGRARMADVEARADA